MYFQSWKSGKAKYLFCDCDLQSLKQKNPYSYDTQYLILQL